MRIMIQQYLLTLLIFLPLMAVPVILFLPAKAHKTIRWTTIIFTALQLALTIYMLTIYNTKTADFQFVEKYNWIPAFNVEYHLGVDGLAILMVLLTPLICFVGIFASWNINKGVKGYFILYMILNTGMMGVFCSLDFFLFYVFWEVMLLPMYFLIGIWGGPRKEYAAIKFFLYTLAGSVLMLLALLALYFNTTNPEAGGHTFNLLHYMAQGTHNAWLKGFDVRVLLFLGLFIGFAIKVPLFPFHTWLPDAHVEAPTAMSVILAGVLLKMGTYGLMRISYTILPEATKYFAIPLLILAFINIVYGAFVAM